MIMLVVAYLDKSYVRNEEYIIYKYIYHYLNGQKGVWSEVQRDCLSYSRTIDLKHTCQEDLEKVI